MITLNTTIWDGDFDQVLDEKSWFLNYQNDLVKEKLITVNNVKKENLARLQEKIKNAQTKHKIRVIFVDDVKEEAKKFFNLKIDESTLGYYYTIQYFVFILKCSEPYVFNVSADCDVFFENDYFVESIKALKADEKAVATTLSWNQDMNVGLHEQNEMFKKFGYKKPELENFYYSVGFSDQVFFADIAKLKNVDFNIQNKEASQFPKYGGECFEKRLCSYFLAHHSYRLIYKKYYYVHNIPKTPKLYKRIFNKMKKILSQVKQ